MKNAYLMDRSELRHSSSISQLCHLFSPSVVTMSVDVTYIPPTLGAVISLSYAFLILSMSLLMISSVSFKHLEGW